MQIHCRIELRFGQFMEESFARFLKGDNFYNTNLTNYLTLKRFDTAVDMLVLLKTRAGGKGFATFRTGMTSSSNMCRPYMSL